MSYETSTSTTTTRRRRADPPTAAAGLIVALVAATGLVVGVRSILHVEVPRLTWLLGLDALSREGLGLAWTERTLWPADIQGAALERLLTVLVVLVGTAVLVAALNLLILLAQSAADRRAELAVRSAVGARPVELAGMLLRELRTLVFAGSSLGLLAGLAGGAALRALWPAVTHASVPLEGGDVGSALLVLALAICAAYVGTGLRAARPERAAAVLRAGTRTGADPMAVFLRKALTAGHTAVAGTVLVGTLALGRALEPQAEPGDRASEPQVDVEAAPPNADAPTEGALGPASGPERAAAETGRGTYVLDAVAPGPDAWARALARLADVPGVEAESLSAPGALIGLGVRDIATAECGNCIRGMMPAPLWNVVADHHAVAPGYLELAGLDLVDGRDFRATDRPGAELVAIVNRTFARTAFERGLPIGKRVRVGGDFDAWFTVVGVVEDTDVTVLGGDESPKSELYLSALQQSPRHGAVLVRGTSAAAAAAADTLAALGFDPSVPRTLEAYQAESAAPLRWAYHTAAVIALIALLLAAQGVYTAALQTTRRRFTELAIRRALGAHTRRIVAYVLVDRLRVVAWGLAGFAFFGTLMVAVLQNAAGLPAAPFSAYAGIAALLALVATAASARAAGEATRVRPAALLD